MALTPSDIQPGDRITFKVTQAPTNEAGRKTVTRLLLKDPELAHRQRIQKQIKQSNIRYHQRGGRPWAVHPPKQPVVHAQPGESATVLASMDVLRDLGSVHRFVEVAKA